MANDENMPPGTDLLGETSINMASDRARRINSLHRSVEDLTQEQNRKRLQISSEVSALTKQQQKLMHQLEAERGDMTSQAAMGYNDVLKGLGRTINSLATGVKNITIDTGKATAGAINQYGKAIGEDISINKTNTIATALSTATPIFGYFAAKFMETDVFKDAATRIKDRLSESMSEGISKAGGAIRGLFSKNRMAEGEAEIPHMQTGGFIKKGGIVEVHSAEIVAPIDKILKEIDKAKSADISEKLNKTLTLMSERLSTMETIVVEREENQQKGIIKTFIEEFQKVRDTKEASWQRRLLKAVLELKVAMVGMTSRLRIAWQRTLLQHPAFRNMLLFSDIMQSAIISPLQFLFGARGGYTGEVRKATSTHNVFLKVSNMLSLIYTTLMPKIDDLLIYTKAQAEAIVGGPISPSQTYTYTMFDKIREFMTSRSIVSTSKAMFDGMIDNLGLDKEAMAEAGISKFSDFMKPGRVLKRMGVTKQNVQEKFFGGKDFETVKSDIHKLMLMKKDQEKREGPHSPSMAQNIASTAKATEEISDTSGEQLKESKTLKKRLKDFGSKIWEYALFAFSFLKDLLFRGISKISKFLLPLLSTVGGTAGAMIGKTGIGAAVGAGAAKLGGGLATAGKFGLGLAGRMAGLTAGGLIGGGMGLWDMFQAIRQGNATGFVGNWLIRGIAGFMGGTDTGLAGATHGALKGGALGAAAGSVIPGLGTMIGGAIGAAAGGLLGFVGGKKISEGISKTLGTIGSLVKGLWNVITFPMKAFKEITKSIGVLAKFGFEKMFGKINFEFKSWLSTPGFISKILDWIKKWVGKIVDVIKGAFTWIWEKLDLKERLYKLMFPIVTLAKVFTTVRDLIDKNIEKIPVIGSIYKRVKATVKSIHNRTFATDLDKWLHDEGAAPWEPKNSPRDLSAITKFTGKDLAFSEAEKEAYKLKQAEKTYNKMGDRLGEKIENGTRSTTAAIIQNTNVVSQTNSSLANIAGGGGMVPSGGGSSFSSGSRFASDVTRCNIN